MTNAVGRPDAVVVGAGVSGLTTAVRLAEAGLRIRVLTAEPPEATTSMAAGAMWGPYLVEPIDKVRRWSRRTLEQLRRLAATPGTGVRLVPGVEASRARQLVPDPDLTAIRGQLVVVDNPGITEFFAEDTGPVPDLLSIYPHGDTVVLGGLAAPGDYNLQPDPAVADAILTRCIAVQPRLQNARVLHHRVGLRPTRPQVRVEAQPLNGTVLIHNYGHGGAGVTLSWGCADDVAELVRAHQ